MKVHRFRNKVGFNPPEGPTFYLSPQEARQLIADIDNVLFAVATGRERRTKTRPNKPVTELSNGAQALLARLKGGKFYATDSGKTPKAMTELLETGHVVTTGRAGTIIRCYVPVEGYLPYIEEAFE